MSIRHISISVSAAVLLGLGAAAPAAAQAALPSVITLSAQSVGNGFGFDGNMQARTQATVSAQASGRVLRVLVKAGDRVKKGQVLAEIDDRMSQNDVAAATAQWRNAQAQLERTQSLVKKGFMSEAALDNVQAQVRSAEAARAQAQLALSFTKVTAPQSGLVLNTHVEAGDLAAPGAPIVTVYQPELMRAVVHVPASLLEQVRQANGVQVHLSNGQWVTPASKTVMPAADPVSQTVEVRLDLKPQDTQSAIPGEQLQVRFHSGNSERLVVPMHAVVRRGELTAVYVAHGDGDKARFVLQPVRLGQTLVDGSVVVVAGLKAGDRVSSTPVAAAQTTGKN